MRLASWNVNGIRAIVGKNFMKLVKDADALALPDVICLQETKADVSQVTEALLGLQSTYKIFANSATSKKGYSGTAILSKTKPLAVEYGIGVAEHDQEGRVVAACFESFGVVTVYTPNSGQDLKRLEYRKKWDADFVVFLDQLAAKWGKPLIVCGDFNVAHEEIDIARPKSNYNKSAGYTQQEIDGFSSLCAAGFIDSFRSLHPAEVQYSWWSYRGGARSKNIGWRLDYVLVPPVLMPLVEKSEILSGVEGSDHCPVVLSLKIGNKTEVIPENAEEKEEKEEKEEEEEKEILAKEEEDASSSVTPARTKRKAATEGVGRTARGKGRKLKLA
jgi:exodeoxyribonuclease III